MRVFKSSSPGFRGLEDDDDNDDDTEAASISPAPKRATVKTLVRAELQDALNSAKVQRQLVAALDLHTQVQAVFVESKQLLLQQLIADLNLGSRLTALLGDERIQAQLVAHVDVPALLASVDLQEQLRRALVGTDLFAVAQAAWPSAVAATKRNLAQDAASSANAALALNVWVLAGLLVTLYAAAVTEALLCITGWAVALALGGSAGFGWVWLPLLLHSARVGLLGLGASRLPTTHALVRQLSAPPPAPLASSPEAAATAASPRRQLAAPLLALVRPLLLLSGASALADAVVLTTRLLALRSAAAALATPTLAELVAAAALVGLLGLFAALDLLPLLCWPLLRWALPEPHAARLRAALAAHLPPATLSRGSLWPAFLQEDPRDPLGPTTHVAHEARRPHEVAPSSREVLRPMQSWLSQGRTCGHSGPQGRATLSGGGVVGAERV